MACKCAYRGDRRTFCWLEFWLDTTCKPSCQAQWSGESMTVWIWNTIKHNAPTSGCTNISTILEIIVLSFAGQYRNHMSSNHYNDYMSEKSPFCHTAMWQHDLFELALTPDDEYLSHSFGEIKLQTIQIYLRNENKYVNETRIDLGKNAIPKNVTLPS